MHLCEQKIEEYDTSIRILNRRVTLLEGLKEKENITRSSGDICSRLNSLESKFEDIGQRITQIEERISRVPSSSQATCRDEEETNSHQHLAQSSSANVNIGLEHEEGRIGLRELNQTAQTPPGKSIFIIRF